MQATQDDRLDLDAFIADLAAGNEPVLFVPNAGNAGDALIGHATYSMFRRLGVRYQNLPDYRSENPSGRIVICAGGGNLVPIYDRTRQVLQWAAGRARRLVILPHTVRANEDLLARLGPETDIICRDRPSLAHVRSCAEKAGCHIANDMAFSLDPEQLLNSRPDAGSLISLALRRTYYKLFRPSAAKTIPSPGKLLRSDRLMARRSATVGSEHASGGTLCAFRTDVEKSDISLPDGNIDIARTFAMGTRSELVCGVASFHMLRYLRSFDVVRTNRLHVSIAAGLLGKSVELHPNSYGKNESVYEYSMRNRMPNVSWHGATPGTAIAE